MIVIFCDLHNRKMSDAEVAASQQFAKGYVEEHPERAFIVTETFCSECLRHAAAYLDQKWAVWEEIQKQLRGRWTNHRNRFLDSRRSKLEAVK